MGEGHTGLVEYVSTIKLLSLLYYLKSHRQIFASLPKNMDEEDMVEPHVSTLDILKAQRAQKAAARQLEEQEQSRNRSPPRPIPQPQNSEPERRAPAFTNPNSEPERHAPAFTNPNSEPERRAPAFTNPDHESSSSGSDSESETEPETAPLILTKQQLLQFHNMFAEGNQFLPSGSRRKLDPPVPSAGGNLPKHRQGVPSSSDAPQGHPSQASQQPSAHYAQSTQQQSQVGKSHRLKKKS